MSAVTEGVGIDADEVARFDAAAADWWEPKGPAQWLHKYNPVRVAYIRDAANRGRPAPASEAESLRGRRVLDIGCGAGVLCEPLARLGADVVGADPASALIETARSHARAQSLDIDYRCTTSDDLADAGERFDVVVAMEVIEHVPDPVAFLRRSVELLNPGGVIVMSTINRTLKSYVQAIVFAEYLLKLLPRGAHEWRKFVRPQEAADVLEAEGLRVTDISGVTMNLRTRTLQLSRRTGVNYIMSAARPLN